MVAQVTQLNPPKTFNMIPQSIGRGFKSHHRLEFKNKKKIDLKSI